MRPSLPLAKGSTSSKRWLARQFRDPYVQQRMASPAHYRSRSAFKLLEMDKYYNFISRLRRGSSSNSSSSRTTFATAANAAPEHAEHAPKRPRVIVDLGAAPGGWSQVVALKCGYTDHLRPRNDEPADMDLYGFKQSAKLQRRGAWSDQPASSSAAGKEPPSPTQDLTATTTSDGPPLPTIIAVDLLRMLPIPGVHVLQTDFLSPAATDLIRALLPLPPPPPTPPPTPPPDHHHQGGCVDLLLSDMAANTTGNPAVDIAHSLRICHAVARFAEQHLAVKSATAPGGTLVLKYFMHPDTQHFCRTFLQPSFRRVYHAKPPSSRPESAERYWICVDWLGGPTAQQPPSPAIPTDPFQLSLSVPQKRTKTKRNDSRPPGPIQKKTK